MICGDFNDFGRFLATKNKAKQSQSLLAPSTAGGLKTNLKKQSQFAGGRNGVISYLKGVYGNIATCGLRKNKANSKPIPEGSAGKSAKLDEIKTI